MSQIVAIQLTLPSKRGRQDAYIHMFRRASTALGFALCLAAAACTKTAETTSPPPVTLRISRTTANDFESTESSLPDIRFHVVTEGGSSITSLHDLRRGTIDFSMPMADVAYLAYSGQLEEMPGRFDQLRGMAVLTPNTVHLVVGGHTTVRTLGDLRGLKISLGPPGSAIAPIAEQLLKAHGISLNDVDPQRLPNPEFADNLVRRRIDAAFVTFPLPNAGVTTVAKGGARLVEIAGPAIEELRTRYPYLKRTVIPRLTYPNQREPVHTIGVDVLLVCRADLDEGVVYRLLDAYFATRPATRPPDLERAPATPIPLHSGAARYYRQRELSR
jgi:TRAP transporter TAXI family solute receptor